MKTVLTVLFLILAHFRLMGEDNERIVSVKLSCNDGLPDNAMRYMVQDSVGNMVFIWLTGACRYDGYNFTILDDDEFRNLELRYMSRPEVPPEVHTDNKGNPVEVDYKKGEVCYMDKKTGKRFTIRGAFDNKMLTLSNNVKVSVLTDKRDMVWVSINGNGVFLLDKGSGEVRHISAGDPEKLIDSDYVVCMTEDALGNIWVSQDKYGVAILSIVHTPYEVIDTASGSAIERQKSVRLLRRLADGRIIIADDYGSVYMSDDELGTLSSYIHGGEENFISAEVDASGRLWLGSRTKGVVLPDTTFGEGRIDCVFRDSKNRMWTCGLDGVVAMYECLSDGALRGKYYFTDVSHLMPRDIIEGDEEGVMWLASGKGVFKFKDDGSGYERVSQLPALAVCNDGNGGLWYGTQGYGVVHLVHAEEGYKEVCYTVNDGLTHNTVNSLLMDGEGNLLAGTNDGISICRYDGTHWQVMRAYESQLRNYCNEKCVVALADGRYAFGTLDGILLVDVGAVGAGYLEPGLPVTVSGIDINGQPMTPDDISCVIGDGMLTVAHDRNSLAFRVSDFGFGIAGKSLYSFMLEGYDRSRGPWTDVNFVSYPNLPPGKYKLKVWSKSVGDNPFLLDVVVRQSPWATPWAIAGYIALTLAVICAVGHYLREKALLRQSLVLEKRLTEFKIKFFTDISHEFKLSLTLIMASLHRVKMQIGMTGGMRYRVGRMEQNVHRMTRLVNQLMDFKRLEDDKLRLSLQPTAITPFLRNVYSEFQDYARRKGVNLSYYSELKSIVVYIDRGVFDKIVYNLLSNALRYTPEGNSVILSVRLDGDVLVIAVTDTGAGVPPELRGNLFDRYVTSRLNPEGMGIGLGFTKELVSAHHGAIRYMENVPRGSIFEVRIPVGDGEYDRCDYLETVSGGICAVDEKCGLTHMPDSEELPVRPVNPHRILFVEGGVENVEMGEEIGLELKRTFDVEVCVMDRVKDLRVDGKFDLLLCHDLSVTDVKNIRKIEGMMAVPLLLLADPDILDRSEALRAGADVVMDKPVGIGLLVSQCVALIIRCSHLSQKSHSDVSVSYPGPMPVMSEADRLFVNRLDTLIHSNPALSIDFVCDHFGFSRASLARRISIVAGCSSKEYLTRKKMDIASQWINEGVSVGEVADRLGFSNAQNFATSFKRYFGKSPLQYKSGK